MTTTKKLPQNFKAVWAHATHKTVQGLQDVAIRNTLGLDPAEYMDVLSYLEDMAETKNVRGILQAVASTPMAFKHRGQLCRAIVKALQANGHLPPQDAGNMHAALYMSADVSLTRENLEGLIP